MLIETGGGETRNTNRKRRSGGNIRKKKSQNELINDRTPEKDRVTSESCEYTRTEIKNLTVGLENETIYLL